MKAITKLAGAFGRATPYFRGKQRILEGLASRKQSVRAQVWGVPMELDLGDVIQRQLFFGYYEPRETALVRRHLGPGEIFVDVGANVGAFTALASALVGPSGRVLAFEPTPILSAKLQHSFAARANATVFPHALGAGEGELRLFLPPPEMGNFDPSAVEYCAGMESISVPVRALDDVLSEQEIDEVDFLKVDVEGFEPEVFEGAAKALKARAIRYILVELNEPLLQARGYESADLERLLQSNGYKCREIIAAGGGASNALYER